MNSISKFLTILNRCAPVSLLKSQIDWVVVGPCSCYGFRGDTEFQLSRLVDSIVREVGDKKGTILVVSGCCGSYFNNQQERIIEALGSEITCIFAKVEDLHEGFPFQNRSVMTCIKNLVENGIIASSERSVGSMDIPRDKTYPADSVQCNECGGNGCGKCDNKGWLIPRDNPGGRRCLNESCNKPISPAQIAVYCSNECAAADA